MTATLEGVLAGLSGGDRLSIEAADGGPDFVVTYDEHPAYGDNGAPVPGDSTGDFTVYRGDADDPAGWRQVAAFRVGPHGSSGYGNAAAKGYAAERVAKVVSKGWLQARIAELSA